MTLLHLQLVQNQLFYMLNGYYTFSRSLWYLICLFKIIIEYFTAVYRSILRSSWILPISSGLHFVHKSEKLTFGAPQKPTIIESTHIRYQNDREGMLQLLDYYIIMYFNIFCEGEGLKLTKMGQIQQKITQNGPFSPFSPFSDPIYTKKYTSDTLDGYIFRFLVQFGQKNI